MIERFSPRLDILSSAQRELWPLLRPSIDLGFVLYGGTAIALQLGHRSSVDFDFFTDRPLEKSGIRREFAFMESATVLQDELNTFTAIVPSPSGQDRFVNVSFFGGIEIGRVGVPQKTDEGVMLVASLDDLMATKVKVLLQRVEAKDYQDIAAMLEHGVSLSKGLAAARLMYGNQFQPSEALKAMVYFEGGDLQLLNDKTKNALLEAVQSISELPQVNLISHQLSTGGDFVL